MIEILVFTQDGCRYCGPTKLFLSEQEAVLENVKFKYVHLSDMTEGARNTYKDKYRLMSAPTIIFFRNEHEMARTSGPTAIEEFEDALEYARTAK